MPKLRSLSGKEVLRILQSFGFNEISRRGSHVKLRREAAGEFKQTLTIPDHPELDRGTIRAIYRQALRYVPETELKPHFYAD
ncbi:MAG: type II toxin-antitoxin system HicA family toxin [Acidobacteria bacterium]|nr:type II toxin-antitoxin system HicA family toxin [Acidobacteriota bacterium]